jgi:glycosyltransferase involved in cell wall biosynthesis
LLKISIVTPSFNQAQFLEQTILSIIHQNYPHLEYIIIDGGSTDGSVDIIRKYEKHLKYWVSEKDRGQAHAINKGFALCTGDVLNWINADDRLLPDALNSLSKAVSAYPEAGAWVGSCNLVDTHGVIVKTRVPRGLRRDKIADWGIKGHFFQPACFFSRDAWEKFGPLDEDLRYCFDLDLYLKIIAVYKFFAVGNYWTEAVVHRDAKTQRYRQHMKEEVRLVQMRYGFNDLANDTRRPLHSYVQPDILESLLRVYNFGLGNFYNIKLHCRSVYKTLRSKST